MGKRTTLHSAHVLHPHTHRRPRTVRGGVHPSTPAPPVVSPFPSPQPEFNFEDPDPSAVDTQVRRTRVLFFLSFDRADD